MAVSVIIPVYNLTDYLQETISSAVNQTCSNQEVIVIDDGSVEKAAVEIKAICSEFPSTRLHRIEHSGVAIAREVGVSISNGDKILFLDADDLLTTVAITHFEDSLTRNTHIDAVYANVEMINQSGESIGQRHPSDHRIVTGPKVLESMLARRHPFCNGSICIRKEVFSRMNVDNKNINIAEDWIFWCHLAASCNIDYVGPQIVLHRRKHDKNISNLSENNNFELLKACERIFSNPLFHTKLSNSVLHELRNESLSRIYLRFARHYAISSKADLAKEYLDKIHIPLSQLNI